MLAVTPARLKRLHFADCQVEIPYVCDAKTSERSSGGRFARVWVEAKAMSDDRKSTDDEPVPVMQQLLDNPFILLFIGILVPTMTYIVWGIMELISIPIAQ